MVDNQQENQGNPEIGMQEDSFDSAESTGSSIPNSTSGSEDFFNELENTVNGGILDDIQVTQQDSGPTQVTHDNQQVGSENVTSTQSESSTDWETRYKDSSREAVKWRDRYKQVEQFVPVLDAMKKDSGLVDHVRDYLVKGGAPAKSITDQLNIKDDFIFDQQEAMTNPDSDSAKVMDAHVDTLVQRRVQDMLNQEKQRAQQVQAGKARVAEEQSFKDKNNMSDEDFKTFKDRAQKHVMTLDDINYLLNKGQTATNVAQSTKQDMLNQMKNVRNMPTSASGANSQGETKTVDREVFENILGFDNNVDNLFG